MELLRLMIVYPHLIACCVAIGLVLMNDIAMVKNFFTGEDTSHYNDNRLSELQKPVSLALIALWITGIAIISLDASVKGCTYFLNPKLQAKVGIVMLLTLNGLVLHSTVMPAMQKAGSLLNLPFGQRLYAIFTGVVSGVSWLYAALLGMGHSLSWKYSLLEILAAYTFLIAGGFSMMLLLTAWLKHRNTAPSFSDDNYKIKGA